MRQSASNGFAMKDGSSVRPVVAFPSGCAADRLDGVARPLRIAAFAAALVATFACVSMAACTAVTGTRGASPTAAVAPPPKTAATTADSITAPAAPASTPTVSSAAALTPFVVQADGIPAPLEGRAGSALRGKALLVEHESANCVLCHAMPQLGLRFSGNVGPSLETVGRKFSLAQLRLRVVDSTRLDPATTMPSYYRIAGLDRVATPYRARPILDAQQVEDVIAYLAESK
jgi:sulfur-oxidizing protein SoxX